MEKPLFQKIFKQALKSQFAVVRFNWDFFTNQKEPSQGLKAEAIQLEEMLEFLTDNHKIPARDIIVAAKSFGSQVVIKIDPKLYGDLALITPNCDKENIFLKRYDRVLKTKKKIQISISVNDPYCDLEQIYTALPSLNKEHSIYTLSLIHI